MKVKHNGAVAHDHLLSDDYDTDIMYSVLQPLAEFEHLRDPKFRSTLRGLKVIEANDQKVGESKSWEGLA